jgi:predicted GTPase
MSKILEIAKTLISVAELEELANLELAASEIEMLQAPSVEEQYIVYLSAALTRMNNMIDKNKKDVFADILNIQTRARVERAIVAYDKAFLLNLQLSLESVAELASELIMIAKRFKVPPPNAWVDVSKMRIDLKGEDLPTVSRQRPAI